MQVHKDLSIYFLSERAITVEFGNEISEHLLHTINSFAKLVNKHSFPGMYNVVTAYTTLSIFFDPIIVIKSHMPGIDCFEKVSGYIRELTNSLSTSAPPISDIITIPVCYDNNEYGPDLQEVAKLNNLTVTDIIQVHTSAIYKVYMIGFVPGFAYMGGMPEILATPRRVIPRKSVPAGSVGIAGKQTGVYPLNTPGGWQIIGRTPVVLFDVNREQPSLLKAGDRVIFKSIDHIEFEKYSP